jgi:hypothetical protein
LLYSEGIRRAEQKLERAQQQQAQEEAMEAAHTFTPTLTSALNPNRFSLALQVLAEDEH